MKLEYSDPREVWKLRVAAGKASNYIRAFDDIEPGDKVVLWLRVSKRYKQVAQAHLRDQERQLRATVAERGGVVVAVYKEKNRHGRVQNGHRGPGCEREYTRDNYWGAVGRAAMLAKKHGAKLLATEADRFVRNPYYVSNEKDRANLQARDFDLADLRLITDGVVLVTLLHPDATADEARSHQITRSRKCGRPAKDRRADKQRRKEEVGALHTAGVCPPQIAARTGVPRRTVRRWIGAK